MHNFVPILLRILAGVTSAMLFYMAFFLYEDQEQRLQNRLEEIWVRIDDLEKLSSTKESAFLHIVSRICTQLLDSLFGRKLVSLQATAVAFMGAGSSFLYFTAYLGTLAPQLARHRTLSVIMASWVLLLLLLLSYLRLYDRRLLIRLYIIILITLIVLGRTIVGRALALEFAIAITITLLCVVLFRWILRKCEQLQSMWLLGSCLVVSIIVSVVIILPASIFAYDVAAIRSVNVEVKMPHLWHKVESGFITFNFAHPRVVDSLITVSAMSAFSICGSVLIVLLMLLLIVHRLFWPLIKRPIYAANRHGLIKNGKLLGALGIMLLLYAFPNNPFVKWLTEFLPKLKGGG